MSLVIERFLACDGDGCDNTHGVDQRNYTTRQHRWSAKHNGWKRVRRGQSMKDFCDECVILRGQLANPPGEKK